MSIALKAIANALAARYAAGTISTPSGAQAMRASYGQTPKNTPTTPCAIVVVQDGSIIANAGQWNHELQLDVVFLISKRTADTPREETARQLWLGTLLAATEGQFTLGLSAASGYSVQKALPTGWEFTEYNVAGDDYDAVIVHFTIYATENVSLTA